MGSLQLDITMRGLSELILLLVGLVDLGSSYTSIPDSICHEKFGLDFCNCVQICNSLGECELVNATNCPIEAPTQAPSPRTDCSYDCDGWPYKQCEMSTRWGSASCINPFARRGSTTIYSNYPKCANVPSGCERCDDVCSKRDGKQDKLDYRSGESNSGSSGAWDDDIGGLYRCEVNGTCRCEIHNGEKVCVAK